MEASLLSKPLSQSECRIKITSQLLSESECRNLGHDLTQKTQTNKIAEAQHSAEKHYLLMRFYCFFGMNNLSLMKVYSHKMAARTQVKVM